MKVLSSLTVLSRNPQAGNYVHRNSVASVIQSSPCVRVEVEKRKKEDLQPYQHKEESLSPKKARITEESTSHSSPVCLPPIIKITQETLETQSLEGSILVGRC